MIEPSLFGIAKSQWEIINSFASWLSAISTLAAVWVSLHLANRISSPRAEISIRHQLIIEPGTKEPYPEFVVFRVVNHGDRTLRVTGIGWKVGFWKKRFAMQMFETSLSSPLPVELAHGQEAQWFVPLVAHGEPWLTHFAKGMLMPNFRVSCRTLRGQVFTSLGHVFEAKPVRGLISNLTETCEGLTKVKMAGK